jgi:hypothetical protein
VAEVAPPLTADETLKFWRIDRAEALKLAYLLVLWDRTRFVPHDIRKAFAEKVRKVGGSRALSNRILNGEFDNMIGALLK